MRIPITNPETLIWHRKAFTLGWCAAFVQFGRVHIVLHALPPEVR